jgi:hypothetical protein
MIILTTTTTTTTMHLLYRTDYRERGLVSPRQTAAFIITILILILNTRYHCKYYC